MRTLTFLAEGQTDCPQERSMIARYVCMHTFRGVSMPIHPFISHSGCHMLDPQLFLIHPMPKPGDTKPLFFGKASRISSRPPDLVTRHTDFPSSSLCTRVRRLQRAPPLWPRACAHMPPPRPVLTVDLPLLLVRV